MRKIRDDIKNIDKNDIFLIEYSCIASKFSSSIFEFSNNNFWSEICDLINT